MTDVANPTPIAQDASPLLQLRRLQVFSSGRIAYDERFHDGVNIIRGENGSGKSTIADFIFFALGGEFDDWKEIAKNCDEVMAEVLTTRGLVCIRRQTSSKQSTPSVFLGPLEEASKTALDGWERFPLHRKSSSESFSQIMFRSMLLPEAQSEGASNITMHQILRLLYADQRTPATRLFRFELFDTKNIRSAVGDMVCGINDFEIFELQLRLRELEEKFSEAKRRLDALYAALPSEDVLMNVGTVRANISDRQAKIEKALHEIQNVDEFVQEEAVRSYLDERKAARQFLQKLEDIVDKTVNDANLLEMEIGELEEFSNYLVEMITKVAQAEHMREAIGNIEFEHCPSCLQVLVPGTDDGHCHLCSQGIDEEVATSSYNRLRLNYEIQHRETGQLLTEKRIKLAELKTDLRSQRLSYKSSTTEFSTRFDSSSSPRESFLAERNLRIGELTSEVSYLEKSMKLAEQISKLSEEKAELQKLISVRKDRLKALEHAADKRRRVALSQISDIAARLLRSDLKRQDEFQRANTVSLKFADDAILVDGAINFAESSNVYLKNSAILSLLLAASKDKKFNHPHFLLLDNMEDKGMEMIRSHHFQRLLVETVTEIKQPYQVIFTTSMLNPDLDLEDYTIGPHYDHDNKTLNVGRAESL